MNEAHAVCVDARVYQHFDGPNDPAVEGEAKLGVVDCRYVHIRISDTAYRYGVCIVGEPYREFTTMAEMMAHGKTVLDAKKAGA